MAKSLNTHTACAKKSEQSLVCLEFPTDFQLACFILKLSHLWLTVQKIILLFHFSSEIWRFQWGRVKKCEIAHFLWFLGPQERLNLLKVTKMLFSCLFSLNFSYQKVLTWFLKKSPRWCVRLRGVAPSKGRSSLSSKIRFLIFHRIILKLPDMKNWVKISKKIALVHLSKLCRSWRPRNH